MRLLIYPFLFRLSESISFKRSKIVVCVTSGLGSLVKGIQRESKVHVVQNGSSAVFSEDEARFIRGSDNKITLAHVGTLTYWDGLLELLEAVAGFLAVEGDDSIELRVIGNGSALSDISSKIRELGLQSVVRLESPVPHEQAIEILHGVDVVPLLKTIPSYGLSPIKFYEARALGCFLICSDIPHINEIKEGEGIVVPFPLEVDEIIKALIFVRRNLKALKSERLERSRAAREVVSWKARVTEILIAIT